MLTQALASILATAVFGYLSYWRGRREGQKEFKRIMTDEFSRSPDPQLNAIAAVMSQRGWR